MTQEAAFHEGYRRALEEISDLVAQMKGAHEGIVQLLREIDAKIERARCLGRSSLASGASGDRGF